MDQDKIIQFILYYMFLIRILQLTKVSYNTELTEKIICKNDTVIAFK